MFTELRRQMFHLRKILGSGYLPFTPLWPFIRLPTEGETRAAGRSGLREDLFCCVTTGSEVVSAQTASTIESTLEDLGRRFGTLSLLKKIKRL